MTLQVIGAGLGRTGTTSLKNALEILGLGPCYHMTEIFGNHPEHVSLWKDALNGKPDWQSIFTDYNTAVDWPTAHYWRELAEFYPEAKVILTVRDPDKWYDSVMSTIYPKTMEFVQDSDADIKARGDWINQLIWQGVFSGRIDDRQHAKEVYLQHAETVKQTIASERLLVMDKDYNWETLCQFLGCDIPEEPYPVKNSRADFVE